MPMTKSTLKTALPTIVEKPTSPSFAKNTPTMFVKSSGAEPPAAMNVAPATSSVSAHRSHISSSAATKKLSHTIASP